MTQEETHSADTATLNPTVFSGVRYQITTRLGSDYIPGAKLPSVRDLASQMGVAPGTVHRVLKSLIRDGHLVARPNVGVFVSPEFKRSGAAHPAKGLEPHPGALRGKRVEVIHSGYGNFIRAIVAAFSKDLIRQGAIIDERIFDDAGLPHLQASQDHDAIALINPGATGNIRFNPDRQSMIVISTGADLSLTATRGYDIVSIEQEHGGRLAGEHYRLAGMKDACFIGVRANSGTGYRPTSALRLAGFEQALGTSLAPEHRIVVNYYNAMEGARAAREYMALPNRPQGVFMASDDLAVGFIAGMTALGQMPGTDYRLIGFDGQDHAQNAVPGGITTVKVPVEEMGRAGARLLTRRLQSPGQPIQRYSLGCSLSIAGTTRSL